MAENEWNDIIITSEEAGERLDKVLAARYREVRSRTYFQHLIEQQAVLLNGKPVKKRIRPAEGDEVEICFALTPELDLTPENIPLDILYEDDDILVVNKPAGLVVHPASGNWTGTFVNALLHHCQNLPLSDPLSVRPGIVHRLDKDTSGLLLAAKNPLAQQRLIDMFAQRKVHKEYLAICVGNPGAATIDAPIGRHPVHRKKMTVRDEGRQARSRCTTLAFDGKLSLVNIHLETGRTHQIRVHMLHHGTPVLGDSLYGNAAANRRFGADRQMLHARLLRFSHPLSHLLLEFKAPLPADFEHYAKVLSPKGEF
jgi:23S rRNA pseudouridine1911/1915/1917 synthase